MVQRTSSEGDAPYFTAGGTLPGSRAIAVAKLSDALVAEGFDVIDSRGVDYSLGWRIRGVKDSMVASVLVGWLDAPAGEFDPFPRLPGRVWVAISVGKQGSNQAWTKVD